LEGGKKVMNREKPIIKRYIALISATVTGKIDVRGEIV
jgi:hypothetical protein